MGMAAAVPAATDPINTAGITAILGSLLLIGLAAVALRVLGHAWKSNASGALAIVAIVAIAALIIGLASGGGFSELGSVMDKSFLNL